MKEEKKRKKGKEKGRGFSYTGYFLPSDHKGHFGSALILGLCLLTVKDRIQYFKTEILDLLATRV